MRFISPQPNTRSERLLKCGADFEPGDGVYVDNELVRRTRDGDTAAFEQLFHRHQKRIYNIALRMLEDDTEAADATQEVFVRAYQAIPKLKADAAFVTWLKTAAVNYCRDMLRKRIRTRTHSLDAPVETGEGECLVVEVVDWSGNPEKSLDAKLTREAVRKAIDSLSPDYREVVVLFYVDGNDVAGIAEILKCPVGTVKSKLSRARAELKRKLEHYVCPP